MAVWGACVLLYIVTCVFCKAMVSLTKLIPSELKRKNSKSPVVQDKTKTSGSSVLSRRTPTEGKHASSLGTEERRGYVSAMKLERKKRKKSLADKIKIKKLSNSKLIVPEEMSSVIGLKSSHTLLLEKVSDWQDVGSSCRCCWYVLGTGILCYKI